MREEIKQYERKIRNITNFGKENMVFSQSEKKKLKLLFQALVPFSIVTKLPRATDSKNIQIFFLKIMKQSKENIQSILSEYRERKYERKKVWVQFQFLK